MAASAEALAQGRRYHQAGAYQQAEQVYRQIVQSDPQDVMAWSLLGSVYRTTGRLDEAAASLQQALRLKPDFAEVRNSLANVRLGQGRVDEAIAIYQELLRLRPNFAEAASNLGVAYRQQGKWDLAIASYRKALEIKPDYADAHNNLGDGLATTGQIDAAVASYRRAIALKPDFAAAHNNLGAALAQQKKFDEAIVAYREALRLQPQHVEAQNNLGNALFGQGKSAEAVGCYEQALRINPDFVKAHYNLGIALVDLGRHAQAITHYQHAVRLQPNYADAHHNLGVAFLEMGKLPEAVATLREVIRLQPANVEAHLNLGLALADKGDLDGAMSEFRAAPRIKPDFAKAHASLAMTQLRMGNFVEGWREYEWRFKTPEMPLPPYTQPRWDGSPAAGRTILFHGEQGLGDILQFIRYARVLDEQGWRVIAAVPPGLVSLLRRTPGVSQVVAQGEPLPVFDVWSPLLSLPHLCGTRLDTIPAGEPYLTANAARLAHWRADLAPYKGFKVGIAWQGNPKHPKDKLRSVKLTRFIPLSKLPGVQLFSLQKGPGSDQLAHFGDTLSIVDLGSRLDNKGGAFEDTAAVLMHLDLLITVDTGIAHLAGALGVPAWVALPFAADWRWLLDREDSPWYPTMRLFRQKAWGDWDQVFADLTDALARQVPGGKKRKRSLLTRVKKKTLVEATAPKPAPQQSFFQEAARVCVRADELAAAGNVAEALALYAEAVRLRPDYPEAHNNWGVALTGQGRLDEAVELYRKAIQFKPAYPDAHNNLGVALGAQKKYAEAVPAYQEAVRLQPDYAKAHFNLGIAFAELGRTDEAALSYREAVRYQPDYAKAHNNLGNIYLNQGKLEAALEAFEQAVRYQADYADAYNNLAVTLGNMGKTAEAEAIHRRLLQLRPNHAEGLNNLGVALVAQQKYDDALRCYEQAVRLKPEYAEAYNNMGAAYYNKARPDLAVGNYDKALALMPTYARGHLNRASALLCMGKLAEGFAAYESRWESKEITLPPYTHPRWNGGPLTGKSILIHAEQGMGDTLQFIRYAKVLQQKGATVVAAVPPSLTALVRSAPGVARVVTEGDPLPATDCWSPLLSLAWLCGTNETNVPADVPYLTPDPVKLEHWRRQLEPFQGYKVGIAWQGNPKYSQDKQRSLPLACFEPLAAIPGVQLISLQKNHGADQIAALRGKFPVVDLGGRLDLAGGAFVDTAAVMKHLDLLIVSDSAIVHLAGAVAAPVWMPLPFAPDWRWQLGREDSPWYPTLRVFRQTSPGEWTGVFARLAEALTRRVRESGRRLPARPAKVFDFLLRPSQLPAPSAPAVYDPEAVRLCGQADDLSTGGNPSAAAVLYSEAVRLQPNYAEAYNNWGVALMGLGQLEPAIGQYRKAIELRADYPDAHNNLGVALGTQKKYEEAAECYRTALRLHPDFAKAYNNLGIALGELERPEEAVACYREAVRLHPGYLKALSNLGAVLSGLGQLEEAAAVTQEALRLQPDNASLHLNLAISWLLQGDFARGWPEYEWRWKTPEFTLPLYGPPRWTGAPLRGKTILLQCEQGLGDTLHFIRYATVLRDQGASVLAVVQPALVPLLKTCPGLEQAIPQGAPVPRFDAWAPLASLPGLCKTDLRSIPATVPYLEAEAERVQRWRGRLAAYPGFKVGVCWQGSTRHARDRQRSVPAAAFLPLAQAPGVQLFSLQFGPGAEQVRGLPNPGAIVDLSGELDERAGAFLDTAAAIKNLDLIVTVDTALAHLAGALGVPVWVMLPFGPDWRWMLDREDSPWYPTMRLFRQRAWGDWSEVFARTAEELGRHIEARRAAVSPADVATETEALRQCKWADTLVGRGDHAAAVPYYREALRLKPDYFEAQNNLGVALNTLGQLEEAAACYRRVIDLRPDFVDGHNNLGVLLSSRQRFAEAVASYEQAIRLQPSFPKAHNNLGTALAALGRIDEALACYQQAIALDPAYVSPHLNRSLAWLLQGRFAEGWPEYEWRWKARESELPVLAQPRWDGGPLTGKTILLHAEQGLGDTLQFIRYAKVLHDKGARVIAAAPSPLLSLLRRCPGVAEVVAQGGPLPPFDCWTMMLGASGLCRSDASTIPADVPYLYADPARQARWRAELQAVQGFKIGIAWQGNPKHAKDRFRSLPLSSFAALAAVPGVQLVSLQKGQGTEQIAALHGRFRIRDFGDGLDADGAFEDTAALMRHLDLVVASDSAVAHLAGGLGVPVWLATPFAPDWRWQLGRGDSPWYPTMRLFRQKAVGNWDEVIERMAAAVRERLHPSRRAGPTLVEIAPGELIDKITILEIKQTEIKDPAKLRHVAVELETLTAARDLAAPASPELDALAAELQLVNRQLWHIEDDIRRCEQANDFGPRFVALARAVYKTNDRRAALKRRINDRLGSRIVEEKSYQGG